MLGAVGSRVLPQEPGDKPAPVEGANEPAGPQIHDGQSNLDGAGPFARSDRTAAPDESQQANDVPYGQVRPTTAETIKQAHTTVRIQAKGPDGESH